MGARGPHDSFEIAKEVIDSTLAAVARGDFDEVRANVDPEIEHVTRNGTVRGPDRFVEEFGPQLERWAMSFYLEDLHDAGEGALIALLEVERRDRESGKVEWKAWPAIVIRVSGGKVVFLEGYVSRPKAFAALSPRPSE
jgi:ketosteroid isomerase-like protein